MNLVENELRRSCTTSDRATHGVRSSSQSILNLIKQKLGIHNCESTCGWDDYVRAGLHTHNCATYCIMHSSICHPNLQNRSDYGAPQRGAFLFAFRNTKLLIRWPRWRGGCFAQMIIIYHRRRYNVIKSICHKHTHTERLKHTHAHFNFRCLVTVGRGKSAKHASAHSPSALLIVLSRPSQRKTLNAYGNILVFYHDIIIDVNTRARRYASPMKPTSFPLVNFEWKSLRTGSSGRIVPEPYAKPFTRLILWFISLS